MRVMASPTKRSRFMRASPLIPFGNQITAHTLLVGGEPVNPAPLEDFSFFEKENNYLRSKVFGSVSTKKQRPRVKTRSSKGAGSRKKKAPRRQVSWGAIRAWNGPQRAPRRRRRSSSS